MPTLHWLGPGTYTDRVNDLRAVPDSEHDLNDEQAEEYLDHDLFGDRWERVSGHSGSGGGVEGDTADGDEQDTADEADEADEQDTADEADEADDDLTDLSGVGDATAEALREAGYGSFDALRDASIEALADVSNLSEDDAESIHDQLGGTGES